MSVVEVPVLIVGGGPAGLTTSILLSRLGVASLLVEKHSGSSPLPRARGMHARAMEILRVAGIEPDLRRRALPITPGAQWRPDLTRPPEREDVVGGSDPVPVSPCEGLAMAQDVLEGVLREHVCRYPAASLRLGTELTGVRVDEDGVRAALVDRATGHRDEVHAAYLVAADGARSGIRDRLGIAMRGPADLGSMRSVHFRADLSRWATARPRGLYLLGDTAAVLIWTHPDDRWVVNVPAGGPAAGHPDPVDLVRHALGLPDLAVEILGENGWTAAAQSAAAYARGPVLLVGDAAHRFPPAGATGISTAMHDAHNLAWKLAAVLSGRAGMALLDTYDAERRPVGERNAGETADLWEWSAGAGHSGPFTGRGLRQIDMGYQYRSAAIVPDGTPDADPPGVDYTPGAAPGCRAPHLWLDEGRSTIDLFERDPVLLTGPDGHRWRDAADRLAGLACRLVEHPGWAAAYGVEPAGAVLVRPDGHVAWRHRAAAPPDAGRLVREVVGTVLAWPAAAAPSPLAARGPGSLGAVASRTP